MSSVWLLAQILYLNAWNSILLRLVLCWHYTNGMLIEWTYFRQEGRCWKQDFGRCSGSFRQRLGEMKSIRLSLAFGTLSPLMLLIWSTISYVIYPVLFLRFQPTTLLVYAPLRQYKLAKILSFRVLISCQLTSLNWFYSCCPILVCWEQLDVHCHALPSF